MRFNVTLIERSSMGVCSNINGYIQKKEQYLFHSSILEGGSKAQNRRSYGNHRMRSTEETTQSKTGAMRVFSNPRYCLYFGGQLISQSGTWMQMVATSWLAYKLTG